MEKKVGKRCLTLFLTLVIFLSSIGIDTAFVHAAEEVQGVETETENLQEADEKLKDNENQEKAQNPDLEKPEFTGTSSTLPENEEPDSSGGMDTGQTGSHSIILGDVLHAEVTAEAEASPGEEVIVTIKPAEGYRVQSFQAVTAGGSEIEYSVKEPTEEGTVLYAFLMPDEEVTVSVVMEEQKPGEVLVTGEGEHLSFSFDKEKYLPGDPVTAVLTPEEGYDIDAAQIRVTDQADEELSVQVGSPEENGSLTVTWQAADTDMKLTAAAKAKTRHSVTVTTQALGTDASVFQTSVDPVDLYEGLEVKVAVSYTGTEIWAATVTYGEDHTDLSFSVSSSGVAFRMPDADVEVVISEREGQNTGDLSAEDGSIDGDWQGNTSATQKENEPDVELGKSARWTDIEDGYAELTITEKDTSDYSNTPTDYIIILDRTRTMSLSGSTWEQGGYPDIVNENSPCINPQHLYYKGGIYLYLRDYYTGYDISSGYWFDNLPGGASSWTKRHYKVSGERIDVNYTNGCQDRLTMSKQALYEMVDQIAENNKDVPDGKNASRAAFWSFADGTYYGTPDSYRVRGLYNYTPWTSDFSQIKRAVSDVKTFSGTYYTESLRQAYHMILERNNKDLRRSGVYTKVIFVSDGICGDSSATNGHTRDEVKELANKIKNLPNTELFTIAMGMSSDSEGARFLAELATQKTDGTYTAAFWQNLSFSGGKGSALAETLLKIDSKAGEIKAANKVLEDQIETEYWEPVEVIRADGTVSLDTAQGKLVWEIPEGAGKTYSCTVRLKLKDKYRYQLTKEAWYETNRDKTGADKDPTKAGAVMKYTISGGVYNTEERETGVTTPKLKYGTVRFEGKKLWMIQDSRAESLMVRLMRTLPSQTKAVQVNNAVTNSGKDWSYAFDVRVMPDDSKKPLIRYDEKGREVAYEVTESIPDFYKQLPSDSSETDGTVTVHLKNEPYKIKAEINKQDNQEYQPVTGAGFAVYEWNRQSGEYEPYQGTADAASGGKEVWLQETAPGHYETAEWLYYRPQNEGRFRIVEEVTPEGFAGDYIDGDPEKEKQAYDIQISEDNTETTVKITNSPQGVFLNKRVQGIVEVFKTDSSTKEPLGGAVFEIRLEDGTVVDTLTTGSDGKAVSQPLDIAVMKDGEYKEPIRYLLAETALEGYLLADLVPFTFTYEGESVPVVKLELEVPDKMVQGILKVAKLDKETLEPVTGMEAEEDQAVFEILDEKKEVVDTFRIGADGYGVSGKLPIALYENGVYQRPRKYYLREKKAPAGYLPETELQEFSFAYVDGATPEVFFELNMENQPNDVKLDVEKSTIELTQEQEVYKYTIDKVRNAGNCRVDNFTLIDELPEEVTLQTLYTGTFKGLYQAESYSLWYTTNLHPEYRLWETDIPAKEFRKLSVEKLMLEEGEEIRTFQYRFGTVEKGFQEEKAPVYFVKAKEKLDKEGIIENRVVLTGDKLGNIYEAEDRTYTKLIQYGVITLREPSGPKYPSWRIIYERYGLDKDGKLIRLAKVQTSDRTVIAGTLTGAVSALSIIFILWKRRKNRQQIQ